MSARRSPPTRRRLTSQQRAAIEKHARDGATATETARLVSRQFKLRPPLAVSTVSDVLARAARAAAAPDAAPAPTVPAIAIDDRRGVLQALLAQLIDTSSSLARAGHGHAYLRSLGPLLQIVKVLEGMASRTDDKRELVDGLGMLMINGAHADAAKRRDEPIEWLLDASPRVSREVLEVAEAIVRIPSQRREQIVRPLRAAVDSLTAAIQSAEGTAT